MSGGFSLSLEHVLMVSDLVVQFLLVLLRKLLLLKIDGLELLVLLRFLLLDEAVKRLVLLLGILVG